MGASRGERHHGRTSATPKRLSADEIARISAVAVTRARGSLPDDAQLAAAVIDRLQPPRWTLEWHLPRWLGDAFGVDTVVVDDLVVANVLGLAALRLADDLIDGEVPAPDLAGATRLTGALYEEAIGIYRDHFAADSPVWVAIRRAMRRWRAGTTASAPGGAGAAVGRSWERQRLARRGEPLKICVSALCLLGGRETDLPSLLAAVEHALAAWVLYDDALDWEDDLEAGRANAFVNALLRAAPGDLSDDVRAEVLVAMLTNDALERYYRRIEREAKRSASVANELGLTEFAEHVRGFGERNGARGMLIQARYHAVTDRAISVFLGSM